MEEKGTNNKGRREKNPQQQETSLRDRLFRPLLSYLSNDFIRY